MQVLFRVLNSLSGDVKQKLLPETDSDEKLACKFAQFFNDKIESIRDMIQSERDSMDTSSHSWNIVPGSNNNTQSLSEFIPLNDDQLEKTFISMNKKFYEFDPIPIMILKECFSDLCPLILNIVNTALANGEFPNAFKHATVTPIIKNNPENLSKICLLRF